MLAITVVFLTVAVIGSLVAQALLYRHACLSRQALAEKLRQSQQRVQQVEQELGALCKASLGAGDHVVRLEWQVQRLMERQNTLDMRASSERPYTQASELVHRGADINELVESCGLTRGEAELLVMMRRGAA